MNGRFGALPMADPVRGDDGVRVDREWYDDENAESHSLTGGISVGYARTRPAQRQSADTAPGTVKASEAYSGGES